MSRGNYIDKEDSLDRPAAVGSATSQAVTMNADTSLLARYTRTGDAQAFAEIARRHGPMVYGVSRRITHNEHDAEDVVQECFMQLTRSAGSITSSLPGWLHRVATNIAKTKIRTAVRRRTREESVSESEPTEASSWEEISPHVDRALLELPSELREVLVLHFMQGRGQSEIAEKLEINQSTVSRRLKWGVQQLRTRLRRTGVVMSTTILAGLLVENAVATPAPPAVMMTLGKMAMSGVGILNPTSGMAAPAIQSNMAKAAAIVLAGSLGLGTLIYIAGRDGASASRTASTSPFDPAQAIATLNNVAAPGPRVAGRRTAQDHSYAYAASPAAASPDASGVYGAHGYGRSLAGPARAGGVHVGDVPPMPMTDESDLSADRDPSGSGARGVAVGTVGAWPGRGFIGNSADGYDTASQGGAENYVATGSAGASAGVAEGGSISFGSRSGYDSPDTVFNASYYGGGAPYPGGIGAPGSGSAIGAGTIAINSFIASDEILWAFTDRGMYGYDRLNQRWFNAPAQDSLADPSDLFADPDGVDSTGGAADIHE